jgi:integrase/recombinase XerC
MEDVIQQFLSYLSLQKRYSVHTVTAYQKDLTDFVSFLLVDFELVGPELATSAMVRSWLAHLKQDKNCTAKSINRKLSSLRSFYKYLLKQGQIKGNPASAVIAPKMAKRLPQYVEEKDTQHLFTHSEFEPGFKGETEFLILQILYQTGIRKSELIGLKEVEINSFSKQIKVLGKGNKERIIPINNQLLVYVQQYIAEKRKLLGKAAEQEVLLVTVTGKPISPRYVYSVVNKYLNQVTTIQKKSPHVLRHTFATQLMNNGADLNAVKELLGHSSLAATQVYTHNNIEKLKEVYKKAHPKA